MSSPLIPEVRVNKNGVPVTKHVKSGVKPSGTRTTLPAPSAPSPAPAKRLPKSRTTPKKWEWIQWGSIRADHKLTFEINKAVHGHMYYGFEASDVEAFEVMRTVDARNVIPLLAYGIRTEKEAVEFLESHGFSRLIIDNSEFATKVMNSGISAQAAIQMKNDLPDIDFNHPRYLDAMEANSYKSLRDLESNSGVAHGVLDGIINIKDIKVLGAGRTASGGWTSSEVLVELQLINAGTSTMTAEQLARLISKVNPRKIKSDPYSVNEAVRFARKYGIDSMLALRRVGNISIMVKRLSEYEEDDAEIGRIVVWGDQYQRLKKQFIQPENMYSLYKAGIPVEEAVEHWEEGMTPAQLTAIRHEGINPSMSSGWL